MKASTQSKDRSGPSFYQDFLTKEQSEEVDRLARRIADAGDLTLFGLVDSLRGEITGKSSKEREWAINRLVGVLIRLPKEKVSMQERIALLNFLLPRVEDTGHVADSLIGGIHYLLKKENLATLLSDDCVAHAAVVLFENSNVQAYASHDRLLLFDLMEHFLQNYLAAMQMLGPQKFVLMFIRSASSERDPRCLLRIFRVFLLATSHFPMGALVEDMFDLIACYFPIDYEPTEKDVGQIDKRMLSVGCEACLLAHNSFAPYCLQLIAEKLMDEQSHASEVDKLETQISICFFLGRACHAFAHSYASIRQNLEDYLVAFRLLILNPAQTPTLLDSSKNALGESIAAIAKAMEKCSEDPQTDLRLLADNMLENLEPFVLQSEMGLTSKALSLLLLISNASPCISGGVVPRVLHWLALLLQGTTIRNQANRKEIAEETIGFVPVWVQQAASLLPQNRDEAKNSSSTNDLITSIHTLFASMESVKIFCDENAVFCAQLASAKVLCSAEGCDDNLRSIADKLHAGIFAGETAQWADPHLERAMRDFMVSYLSENAQLRAVHLRVLCDTKALPGEGLEKRLKLLPCYVACDTESMRLAITFLMAAAKNEVSDMLYAVIEQTVTAFIISSAPAAHLLQNFLLPLFSFYSDLLKKLENIREAKVKALASHLQNVAATFHHDPTCDDATLLDHLAESIFSALSNKSDISEHHSILGMFSEVFSQIETPQLVLAAWELLMKCRSRCNDSSAAAIDNSLALLYFSTINRGLFDTAGELNLREQLTAVLISSLRADICEINARLLNSSSQGIALTRKLFDKLLNESEQDLTAETRHVVCSELLKFGDVTKLGYRCTSRWRQRVVCQIIPLCSEYYPKFPTGPKQDIVLGVVTNLLALFSAVEESNFGEMKEIMPILIEAIPKAVDSRDSSGVELLLRNVGELLQIVGPTNMPESAPTKLITPILKLLEDYEQWSMNSVLSALECLAVLSTVERKKEMRPYYNLVVQRLVQTSKSKKRILRTRAALVRNAWELAQQQT